MHWPGLDACAGSVLLLLLLLRLKSCLWYHGTCTLHEKHGFNEGVAVALAANLNAVYVGHPSWEYHAHPLPTSTEDNFRINYPGIICGCLELRRHNVAMPCIPEGVLQASMEGGLPRQFFHHIKSIKRAVISHTREIYTVKSNVVYSSTRAVALSKMFSQVTIAKNFNKSSPPNPVNRPKNNEGNEQNAMVSPPYPSRRYKTVAIHQLKSFRCCC